MSEPTAGPIVLVIDDEVQIRRLLRLTLEANGYRVFEAARARTASPKPRSGDRTYWCWTSACPTWTA